MRFRRYKGPDVATVLRWVRRELGDGAVIVKTEEKVEGGVLGFFGNRVVEVLVALPEEGRSGMGSGGLDLSLPEEMPMVGGPREGERAGSPSKNGNEAKGSPPENGYEAKESFIDGEDAADDTGEALRAGRGFLPLGVALGEGGFPRRVVAFGPPGSGKTSTLGRLAWHFSPSAEVTLVSVEEEGRLSGVSRWRAFWEVLGIRFLPVKGFQGLEDIDGDGDGVLLVDTPPLGPGWRDDLERVCRKLSLVPLLVVDAAWDLEEFRHLLREYEDLPYLGVVVSKCDAVRVPARRETWRRELAGLRAYISDSPSINTPLKPLGVAAQSGEPPLEALGSPPGRSGGTGTMTSVPARETKACGLRAGFREETGSSESDAAMTTRKTKARPWNPRRLAGG